MTIDTNAVSKLGFGCMRFPLTDPKDQKSIDIEHVKKMVDAFIEGGGTYFDTAYVYHEGTSETALREALVERYPRESYTLATKCLAWASPNAETAKSNLAESLERLGTDYVDFYLLHNLGGARTQVFEDYGMWDFVKEMKAAGKIKHIGFSMHDNSATLDAILTAHPEAEFVQLQVNYLDWEDRLNESRKCMEVARKHGKPVIIMEPARGGRLINNLPDAARDAFLAADSDASLASWAYRFCMSQPGAMTVLAGMSNLEQVQQNMADFGAFKPMSEDEQALCLKAADILRAQNLVDCTNCRYCMKACPQNVQVPVILSLMNLESQLNDHEFVKGNYTWQTREGRASECIACGECEAMCPQQLPIIDLMAQAVERYE